MGLWAWAGSMTCDFHTVAWIPGVGFFCEGGAGTPLSAGALRVFCDRILLFDWWHGKVARLPDWISPSLLLVLHQFIPQMKVYNLQDLLPRSMCLDSITRLFTMSERPALSTVYRNVSLETRGASCVFLIIFLLVHSSRHTLSVPSRPPGATISKTLKSQSWIKLITHLQAFIINERAPARSVDYKALLRFLCFSQGLVLGPFSLFPPNITRCHSS